MSIKLFNSLTPSGLKWLCEVVINFILIIYRFLFLSAIKVHATEEEEACRALREWWANWSTAVLQASENQWFGAHAILRRSDQGDQWAMIIAYQSEAALEQADNWCGDYVEEDKIFHTLE